MRKLPAKIQLPPGALQAVDYSCCRMCGGGPGDSLLAITKDGCICDKCLGKEADKRSPAVSSKMKALGFSPSTIALVLAHPKLFHADPIDVAEYSKLKNSLRKNLQSYAPPPGAPRWEVETVSLRDCSTRQTQAVFASREQADFIASFWRVYIYTEVCVKRRPATRKYPAGESNMKEYQTPTCKALGRPQ